RAREATRSARRVLSGAMQAHIRVEGFRDAYLPWQGEEVKDVFEELKAAEPDLIFTHRRDDAHQDHRVVADLTWNTFRDHTILEYEIPKYDGDLTPPNLYVPLDAGTAPAKARLITSVFRSQADKTWMTEDAFLALLRLRGIECASPSGFAEAFH